MFHTFRKFPNKIAIYSLLLPSCAESIHP